MYQIQQITSAPQQQQTVTLPNGVQLGLTLYYSQQQYGWFAGISYGSTFSLQGLRITVSPNMLYQWKNILPFGLGCFITTANREPTQLQDFSTNLFRLYVLSPDEVAEYAAFLSA